MALYTPTFVVDAVEKHEHEILCGEDKNVFISAPSTKASFAVFLYDFLTRKEYATRAALCVYGSSAEYEEWMDVIDNAFLTATHQRVVNVVDLATLSDAEMLPPSPLVGMISYRELEERFPLRDELRGMVPFVTPVEKISDLTYMYTRCEDDPRAFASPSTPLIKGANSPYALLWDQLVFTHEALCMPSVFYLNAAAVRYNRYLLDDAYAEYKDPRFYYNAMYASTCQPPEHIAHQDDSMRDLMDVLDDMYELIIVDDDVINFNVVLPAPEQRHAVQEIIYDVDLPPLRSIIQWTDVSRPCSEHIIDQTSRSSVMWVHHDELANASRQASSSVETLTREDYATAKTMMIYLYMWINNAQPFYVLCPYVSTAHELHKLQNARPIHPQDELIASLSEQDTLIVFDTIFAMDLRLVETRCRLIFATYCGTQEESALARFLFADRGLPAPSLPTPFRMSPIHVTYVQIDPRRIQLHMELTSIIFYDKENRAHTTLYECMLAVCDQIVALAHEAYYSNVHADIANRMIGYYARAHAAERTDSMVATMKHIKNATGIAELISHRQALSECGGRDERREATRKMWTAAHNYYKCIKRSQGIPKTVNKVTREFDDLGQRLVSADVDRMIALDKTLKRKDGTFSVRIVFNENAMLLRKRIDSRPKPPLPVGGERKAFTCKFCGLTFDSRHYYRQHTTTQHRDDVDTARTHFCPTCKTYITGDWRFAKHMRRTHAAETPRRYQCEECGAVYTRQTLFEAHMSRRHSKAARAFCIACSMSFEHEQLTEHQLSEEHQRVVSGPTQTFCECCRVRCTEGEEMQSHLETETHQRRNAAMGCMVPTSVHLNRWYMFFVASEKLIDINGYYVDLQLRQTVLTLPEARILLGDSCFHDYATLLLISLAIRPSMRKFYLSDDSRNGMLVVTSRGRTGIVGHYGSGDKRVLIAEMFTNMNVECVEQATIAYAPSGMHKELVAYGRHLGMQITRAPVTTSILGRLGVYNAYWMRRP